MSEAFVKKGYKLGTHRLVSPEETLARITPLLGAMDITRAADITGLDRLGIATFTAIRPTGRLIQVANGKGLRPVDARVSALMEAIEVHHAEHPELPVTTASVASLRAAGQPFVHPTELPSFLVANHFTDELRCDWVEAEELHSGSRLLVPASAAYPCAPTLYAWWTNGLASGNHVIEATLHGLYELLERHALSLMTEPDPDPLFQPRLKYMSLRTIASAPVAELRDRVAAAGMKLVLALVHSPVPVHTFMAVLLDRQPLAPTTLVNLGYGTHASNTVAAIRAITEAAQARLAFIHASREDLAARPAFADTRKLEEAYTHFDEKIGGGDWRFLTDHSERSLSKDYESLLAALHAIGATRVLRVDLTSRRFGIPVVKMLVPGLRFESKMV